MFAVAVVSSVLILGHHQPSDILGGFLVAGTWTGLGVAALRGTRTAADREPALRTATTLLPAALVAGALAIVLGVITLADWPGALDYAGAHTTFVAGAGVITLAALGMSAAAAVVLAAPQDPAEHTA